MVTACYQLVSPSHCRERCISCKGKDCVCPGCERGWHFDGGVKNQAKTIHSGFVDSSKDRLFAK